MNDDDLKKLREGRVNIGPTTINAIIDEALFRGAQVRACEDVGVQVILLPDGRASVNNYRALRVEAELAEARAALANAQAVAFEKGARSLEGDVQLTTVVADYCAAKLRRWRDGAAQPNGASGQWVAADVMEQVRNAIEQLAFGLDPEDFARPQDRYAAQLKISEDALKALFPDWNGPAMDEGRSMTRTGSELCAEIEALSSSLPSGHWVAADVMEKVKAALSEHSCDHCPGCEFPHGTSDEGDVAQLRAALSALESEASR